MLDMPRARYPYTHHEKNRHGTRVWYFRRNKEPRVRLRGAWGSPEWLADYEAALTGQPPPLPVSASAGTLRWLVGRYYESTAFANLQPGNDEARSRGL